MHGMERSELKYDLELSQIWIQTRALPLACCVILGKFPNFSECFLSLSVRLGGEWLRHAECLVQ